MTTLSKEQMLALMQSKPVTKVEEIVSANDSVGERDPQFNNGGLPLKKNSVFLKETVDSPMPTSIEKEILVELQKHTLLMKQLVNVFLGQDIGVDHEDKVDSIRRKV